MAKKPEITNQQLLQAFEQLLDKPEWRGLRDALEQCVLDARKPERSPPPPPPERDA